MRLVAALHAHGVRTGVDVDLLARTSVWMAHHLGRPVPGSWRTDPAHLLKELA